MTDIFISYAHEDERRVREIVRALEEKHWSIFWDRRIPAGKTWHDYIGKALSNARCVIVAWSHHSITSEWVIEEADRAKRRGVLVPVLLDSVEPPLGFSGIQAADLTEWKPGYSSPDFDQLIQDIAGVIGAKPPDESEPPKSEPSEKLPYEPKPITRKSSIGRKRPNFLIGAGIALALVIVVGWALWFARESPRVSEPKPLEVVKPEPARPPRVQEPGRPALVQPQVHRDPVVDVERLVARWVDAYMHGRAEDFVTVAGEPFYFDQKVILTKPELRTAYEALLREKGPVWREMEIQSIKIKTARELQGSGYDLSKDRIFGSLNLTLNDYTAIVTAKYRGQSGSMLVVVRRVGDDYEIAGLWD